MFSVRAISLPLVRHSNQLLWKHIPCATSYNVKHHSSFWSGALESHASLFKSLSESRLVEYGQNYFEFMHDFTGLSWWSSLIISTVAVRTCITLPLSMYQSHVFAKIENLQSEMPAIVSELKRETAFAIKKFKWSEKQARVAYNRSLKKQWNKLIIRDNCHPFKGTLVVLVQLPMWVCLSMALRNMASMLPVADASAHLLYLQLSLGGALWFPNLTIPDASYLLPVLMGLINLSIIEIQYMARANRPKSKIQKYATNFFRGLSVAMIPIAASVPTCMTLYWTASSFCGLCCNLFLMSPRVKRTFGIPSTPQEIQQPYRHLLEQIKARFK